MPPQDREQDSSSEKKRDWTGAHGRDTTLHEEERNPNTAGPNAEPSRSFSGTERLSFIFPPPATRPPAPNGVGWFFPT